MKTLLTLMMVMTAAVTQAAGTLTDEGSGILTALLATFCALIIAFQFVPGILMFGGMIKGIFGCEAKREHTL